MDEIERAEANLVVHTITPLNAEPCMDRLVASFVTPQSQLYIRTHGEVQHLDGDTHRVKVTGRVERETDFSVAELRAQFTSHKVMAVLQCAGNRRADLQQVAKTAGDPWQAGAIGNVEWTGVLLRDVLAAVGAPWTGDLQVAFYTLDEIEVEGEKGLYGVSISLAKAVHDEVLLAFEANGEPLAPEHGFPVRVIVPGYAGVRSAKWLGEIRVQEEPADSPIQRRDYKLFPASVTKAEADWDAGLTINAMPVNSAICTPRQGQTLEPGQIMLAGWATASERSISRVDVSIDGGRSWRQATLEQNAEAPSAWTLWSLSPSSRRGSTSLWCAPGMTLCRPSPANPMRPGTSPAISPLTSIASTSAWGERRRQRVLR